MVTSHSYIHRRNLKITNYELSNAIKCRYGDYKQNNCHNSDDYGYCSISRATFNIREPELPTVEFCKTCRLQTQIDVMQALMIQLEIIIQLENDNDMQKEIIEKLHKLLLNLESMEHHL